LSCITSTCWQANGGNGKRLHVHNWTMLLSLCLIKHHAMKEYGEMEIELLNYLTPVCRWCAVSVETGYGLGNRGFAVRVPVRWRNVISPCRPDRVWDPPNPISTWYRGSFPGVKRPGLEADHSQPTSAEVKKTWIYASTPPIRPHGVLLYNFTLYLIKLRREFCFTPWPLYPKIVTPLTIV
jgi:hypothetical protein